MTSRLTDLSLRGAIDALTARDVSAEELTRAHLDAIEALNPRLNAYVAVTGERALQQARASDERRGARRDRRPAGRRAARHQGPVLHGGRAHHRG